MPFRDIAGHQRTLALLGGAASRGTLPPSLIFAGPEGIGKYTAAIALAQALNCKRGRGMFGGDLPDAGQDACGACGSGRCRRATSPAC